MATAQNPQPIKALKSTKPAVAPIARVTEILKKAALTQRITEAELDQVGVLVGALKTFIKV